MGYRYKADKEQTETNFFQGVKHQRTSKKPINQLIKELNKSTLSVKKVGKNKYKVIDVVEFDGNYGIMTEKELRKRFEKKHPRG